VGDGTEACPDTSVTGAAAWARIPAGVRALPRPIANKPKAAKRFAEAIQTRTKTDAVDAAVLAEFAHRMPF